jgi:hypothetical protein
MWVVRVSAQLIGRSNHRLRAWAGLRRVSAGSLALAALVVLLLPTEASSSAAPSQDQAGLFTDAAQSGAVTLAKSPTTVRYRVVEINSAVLSGMNRPSSGPGTELLLNLFPDVSLTAVRDRLEPASSPQGFIWIGHVRGMEQSSEVTLVVTDGIVVGNIRNGDRFYEVRYLGNGVHAVIEVDPRRFGPD